MLSYVNYVCLLGFLASFFLCLVSLSQLLFPFSVCVLSLHENCRAEDGAEKLHWIRYVDNVKEDGGINEASKSKYIQRTRKEQDHTRRSHTTLKETINTKTPTQQSQKQSACS